MFGRATITLGIGPYSSLYILKAVIKSVPTSVTVGVASSVANDVIMRRGAASAVGASCHNENAVIVIIAGLWRYGDWRRGHGLQRSSFFKIQIGVSPDTA